MFESVMGSTSFIKSLQNYLANNAYHSVKTNALFNEFKANWNYPQQDALNFLNSWTKQAGFPYINITQDDDNSYTVTQHRFIVGATNENFE